MSKFSSHRELISVKRNDVKQQKYRNDDIHANSLHNGILSRDKSALFRMSRERHPTVMKGDNHP